MTKRIILSLLPLLCSCILIYNGISESRIDSSLVGTKWYSEPNEIFSSDSLYFYSNDEVRYFMGELSWSFYSDYFVHEDTLTVKTVLDAFEMKDSSGIEPNLIQKYLISRDTLELIYLANKGNGEFIEADSSRYSMINDFIRIR